MINISYIKINKPRLLIGILGLFLFLNSCTSKKGTNFRDITSLKFSSHIQMVAEDMKIVDIWDSLFFFKYKDRMVYKKPVFNNYSEVYTDSLTHNESIREVGSNTTYTYYLFEKNLPFGVKYDSLINKVNTQISYDSFSKSSMILSFKAYFDSTNSLLVSKVQEKNELTEKYAAIKKHDDSYYDTAYYTYCTCLSNLDFSFSKDLEKKRKMKIRKVVFVYNEKAPSDNYPKGVPRRIFEFEINNVEEDRNVTRKFFE